MAKPRLVIYGAADNAGKFVYDYTGEKNSHSDFNLIGFIDDFKSGEHAGFPIFGTGKDIDRIQSEHAVSHIIVFLLDDAKKRLSVCREIGSKFTWPSFTPDIPALPKPGKGYTSSVGKGVLIHDSVQFMGFEYSLGDHCVVGPNTTLEGRITFGEGALICPNVFIGYESSIGEASKILPGAIVCPRVKIGKGCVIYPGVVAHRDLPDNYSLMR